MSNIKSYLKESVILMFIYNLIMLDFSNTVFYKICDMKLNGVSKFFRNIIEKRKNIKALIAESFLFNILNKILKKLWIVNGLVIIALFALPHSHFNNIYMVAGMLLITVLCFLKAILVNDNFETKYIGLSILIFFSGVFLATFISSDLIGSIKQLLFYITAVISYINVLATVKTKEDLKGFVFMMFMMTMAVSFYGIIQQIKGVPVNVAQVDTRINEGMSGRVYSTVDNPNNLAELYLMMIPLCGALLLSLTKWRNRIVVAILTGMPILVMLLTGARSGWGALGIAAFVFCILWDKRTVPLFIIAVMLAFAALPYVSPQIYKRIATIFNPEDTSMDYRDTIKAATLPVLRDNAICGIGLGGQNFSRHIANNHQFKASAPPHSHNVYIQTWTESGLLGIIGFMMLIISNILKSIICIFKTKEPIIRNTLIATVCGIIGMMVMGVVDYVLFYPRILVLFFIFLAIGVVSQKLVLSEVKRNG